MTTPLEGTASAAGALQRVRYSHDAVIDLMIARPDLNQGQIAKHFGYTQSWLSRIVNSDAFNARLAQRKTELVDPSLLLTIEEKFKAAVDTSLGILQEKLELTKSPDLALKVAELGTKALGYGARQQNVNVQQNFVVALPQKAPSIEAWGEKYGGGGGNAVPLLTPEQVTDVNS